MDIIRVTSRGWRLAFITVCGLLLALSAIGHAQLDTDNKEEVVLKQLLNERLQPFREKGNSVIEGSIAEEIDFLKLVFLAEGGFGNPYYKGLLEEWEKCATEKSLPAMERFIKRCAEFKRNPSGKLPWSVFSTLDKGVQELWFKVKTEGMTDEEKAEIALYGFMGDDAPVPIDFSLTVRFLGQVGNDARGPLYKIFRRPAKGRHDNLVATQLTSLLPETGQGDGFTPTDKEIEEYLGMPGTLGHSIIGDSH